MSFKDFFSAQKRHIEKKIARTLTRKEMHDFSEERIAVIKKEFREGFKFLKDYPKSVTIFGGAHFLENTPYYQKAYSVAKKIVDELHYSVLTGGGPGVMEAANKGAFEAKGNSLGLTIKLPEEQAVNEYMTNHLDFYYFFSRKVILSFSAEAYIFFPGGFGTMDEFFEIITLVQTRKIERVPIILVGSDFWNSVDKFINDEMVARGSVEKMDVSLYKITDDENEIINIIRKAPLQNNPKFDYNITN